jgi:hypothetical protein
MSSPRATPQVDRPPTTADSSPSSLDLIIELYKRDVDRTLLIEQLRKTPAQRAEDLQRYHDAAVASRGAALKSRS